MGAGPGLDWDLVRGGLWLGFAVGRMDFPMTLGVGGAGPLVLLVEPRLLVDSLRGEGWFSAGVASSIFQGISSLAAVLLAGDIGGPTCREVGEAWKGRMSSSANTLPC